MKKFIFSLLFVVAGSAMWWSLSNIVRFSVKKWDAKFDTVLRHSLSSLGVSNKNLVASVNQLKSDPQGEYVVRRLSIKGLEKKKVRDLVKNLEDSGAEVNISGVTNKTVLTVKRGQRVYQEISITP